MPTDTRQEPAYREEQLPLPAVEEIPLTPANLLYFGRAYRRLLRAKRINARRQRGRASHVR